jgi:DMSO/TMAO reductase YedYZ heme-binding membrane subunit
VEEFTPILSNPIVAMLPYYLGLLPFLWLISAGVAEAQRFSRVSTLFSFLSFGAIALTLVGLYLSARGVI